MVLLQVLCLWVLLQVLCLQVQVLQALCLHGHSHVLLLLLVLLLLGECCWGWSGGHFAPKVASDSLSMPK